MEVTIDKFGRVLIPKKIREARGYKAGTVLSIVEDPTVEALVLEPVKHKKPSIEYLDWGWAVIKYPDGPRNNRDAVDLIDEDREERENQTAGDR